MVAKIDCKTHESGISALLYPVMLLPCANLVCILRNDVQGVDSVEFDTEAAPCKREANCGT